MKAGLLSWAIFWKKRKKAITLLWKKSPKGKFSCLIQSLEKALITRSSILEGFGKTTLKERTRKKSGLLLLKNSFLLFQVKLYVQFFQLFFGNIAWRAFH